MKSTQSLVHNLIPETARAIQDPFSQDLIYLWDARYMKGKVFTVETYEEPVECLGYLLLQESKKDWTIRGFFVQDQYRGHGIGDGLLTCVDDFISESKKKVCYVNITRGAEGSYLRHGFEILGPRVDFPDQVKAKKVYGN